MIDWLTVVVPYFHSEQIHGGIRVDYDQDGVHQYQLEKFRPVEGSFDARTVIKTYHRVNKQDPRSIKFGYYSEVWVSGNPAKWFQGHNAYGSSDLTRLAPAWVESVFEAAGLTVDSMTRARWRKGDYQIDRVDTTQMIDFGGELSVADALSALGHTASMVHRGRGNITHGTVSFGKRSGRRTVFKAYDKYAEISLKSRSLADDLPGRDEVIEWCKGKLRCEFEVHARELELRGLRRGSSWNADTADSLWCQLMEKIEVSAQVDLTMKDLDLLPRTVQRTYRAWQSGHDVRAVMSPATWKRHRAQLKSIGVDIAAPLQPVDQRRNVVHLPRHIRGSIAVLPSGADRHFYGRKYA